MSELERLQRRHEAGDRLAWMEAMDYCDRHGLPPPPWLVRAAAERCRRFLAGKDAAEAFAGVHPGRTGDPRAERKVAEEREFAVAAYRSTIHAGLTGRARLYALNLVYDELRPESRRDLEVVARDFRAWVRTPGGVPLRDFDEYAYTVSGTLHEVRTRLQNNPPDLIALRMAREIEKQLKGR